MRIVVTGLGLVTPLACNVNNSWVSLVNGKSGIKKIVEFSTEGLSTKIGGAVDLKQIDVASLINPKRIDKFILYSVIAAEEAIKDSDILNITNLNKERVGVAVGSGIGGLSTIEKNAIILHEKGEKRISPFFIPASLISLSSGQISIRHGFKGPNDSNVTACSTGAHSIVNAIRMIRNNEADIMVCGSSESALCRLGVAGFCAMRALSRNNENPEEASRPWDKQRDGFVIGEGAGILVLESYEHAKKRSANIYAEIIGYGLSSDAHHISAPPEDGEGAFRAMSQALSSANLNYDEIDYINAHSTSTAIGDIAEIVSIKNVFKAHKLAISSTKSSIGHLLGAAGSVEAIFTILALKNGLLPPTLNLYDPEEICEGINLIPHKAQEQKIKYALSNSFGFGGTNISLIMKSV